VNAYMACFFSQENKGIRKTNLKYTTTDTTRMLQDMRKNE